MSGQSGWPDVALTALAPLVWGTTYFVTSEFLPDGYPITLAVLRALPAGLLLMLVVRRMPPAAWLGRILVLGALNFAVFWSLLFVAAYTLPGGVAATLGAVQAVVVIILSRVLLGTRIMPMAVLAAVAGVAGVALLLLGPAESLSVLGVAAGLGGAVSMAGGTVLSRKWQPDVSPLTFTAWQLTAGGLLLLPVAFVVEPPLPTLTIGNLIGLVYLGLFGAAITYCLWFRGVARIEPSAVATLGFLSPLTAVVLGWIALDQELTHVQSLGALIVFVSVWGSQYATRAGQTASARTSVSWRHGAAAR